MLRSASAAADALRGKRSFSYAVSAASTLPGLAAMAFASSAPSYMARLAPSPANGDIRCAASPSRVTPGTRSHLCSIGRAWIGRGTAVATFGDEGCQRRGPAVEAPRRRGRGQFFGSEKSMRPIQSSGLFNAMPEPCSVPLDSRCAKIPFPGTRHHRRATASGFRAWLVAGLFCRTR